MARTGTYIAFDGLGKSNPSESDFRFYSTIQAWAKNRSVEFKFVNSHEKTYAVRDSSQAPTLQSRIRERLSKSKNIVVILSSDTRSSGSMLSYEIEQAVDNYDIPLIITYVDFEMVANPGNLSSYWPNSLKQRINSKKTKAIHIGFKQRPLMDAIGQFTVSNMPNTPLDRYTERAYREFGILLPGNSYINN